MRKARLTEHQIIAVLKSVEAGRTVKDVCREAAISEASSATTTGRRNMAGWKRPILKKSKTLKMRTDA